MPGQSAPDLRHLAEAIGTTDTREWFSRGIVVKRQGEAERFEMDDEECLVEVNLVPGGQPVTARLGALVWRIPPEGAEVGVLFPGGQLDAAPVIVCEVGGAPDELAGDNTVLRADGDVVVKAGGDVKVDAGDSKKILLAGGGKGVARKDDPTEDGTLAILFSPGTGAASLSIAYTPGDGSAPQSISGTGGILTLKGKISLASTKVEAG
jgi:hypothetical protein